MKLKFHTEEHRNRFLSLFKRRKTNPLRSEPEYVAAIYLLSADLELWEKVSEYITDENIDFRNIRLSSISTDQYALYKTARDIFNQTGSLKIYDIKAMVYLSEETINLEMSHTLSSAECEIKEEDVLPEPEMNAEPDSAEISDESTHVDVPQSKTSHAETYRLAKKYLKGDSVYPDPEYAIKLFESCGDYKYAGYALGKIYLDGRYATKNLVLAEKYLKNAADEQLDCAEYALGKLYLDDEVRQYDLAEEYLNKAAEHGNVFAMYRLAKLYLSGDIPLNTEKAVELLQEAAEKLSIASYALGKLYLFGREIPQDRELAVYWLTRASDMGNEFAQHLLEHIDSYEHSRVQNGFMNMLLAFARLIRDNYDRADRNLRMHTDKKLRAAIRRKKQALGVKEDHTIRQG